jgi:hypothetical protein
MSNGFQLSKEIGVKADWNVRAESYTEQEIVEGIKDTVDAIDSYEITSVPTPFARWHLVDQAFDWVANYAVKNGVSALTGKTIYHKLVAEALDVAEIFFNFDGLKKDGYDLKITKVNLKEEVANLSKSRDERHINLAETYNLFADIHREKGKSVSIFDAEEINLLSYRGKVIGGTSPICMYFTSTDSNEELAFQFENTTLFKAPHESLLERSQVFRFAQIGLIRNNPGLEQYMPGFYKYVNYVHDALKKDLNAIAFTEEALLKGVDTKDPSALSIVTIGGGNPVRLYGPKKIEGVLASDLVLGVYNGIFPEGQKRPLALSPDYQERKYLFNEVVWNADKLDTHYVKQSILEKRNLPGSHHPYPWFTTSDLLEPVIIRLLGPLDRERFLENVGHFYDPTDNTKGDYLIPIKPLFFKYFNREDLLGNIAGKKVFELNRVDNDKNVEVVLRIPIGKTGDSFIEFKRRYELNAHVDEGRNHGAVKTLSFNIGLIPDVAAAVYNNGQVVLQEVHTNDYPTTLRMAASWKQVIDTDLVFTPGSKNDPVIRTASENDSASVYRPAERFDMIQVVAGKTGGWLILEGIKEETPAHGAAFDIAVDFGTTNTHVALRNRNDAKGLYSPLSLSSPSTMLRTLYPYDYVPTRDPQVRINMLQKSFFQEIGEGKKYGFPIRTAIAETRPSDDPEVIPIGRMNIPFYYQEMAPPSGDSIHTELKWSNLAMGVEKARLNHYFSCILQLAANEVVCRGGDPKDTRLIFFYPSAMSIAQRGQLEDAWKAAYKRTLNPSGDNVYALSESVAPYKFFTGVLLSTITGKNVINCDIGGGTCDAYIQYRGEVENPKIASFRFGGDAVFGDGYDRDGEPRNGFVKLCQDMVAAKVKADPDSQSAYNNLSRKSSEEIISFFLSLSNSGLHKGVNFNFNEFVKTQKPQLQLIYLLYFSSIVYHLAQVTKSLGIEAPNFLSFTGNGSKIIQALGKDDILAKVAGCLIAGVYEEGTSDNFVGLKGYEVTVKTHNEPKEFTCKGGLAVLDNLTDNAGEGVLATPPNVVIMGDQKKAASAEYYLIEAMGAFEEKQPRSYGELRSDQIFKDSVKQNVANMIDILLEIDRTMSFTRLFDVSLENRKAFGEEVLSYVELGLINGLQEILTNTPDDKLPDETLFFLPMRQVLHQLGMKLNETTF